MLDVRSLVSRKSIVTNATEERRGGGGEGEAEYMRQMRVQNCTKSYSFTTLIIFVIAFTNYVIKENTCITFEKSVREL